MLFSPMNAAQKDTMLEHAWGMKDMASSLMYKFNPASSFGGVKAPSLFGSKTSSQPASVKGNAFPVPQSRTSFQV